MLIKEISDLRDQIEDKKKIFDGADVGGIRMLTMIMKAREERDRMLEQIEENERNGGA